ncbi:hypothetical protein BH11MYX4_BH11MYX4_65270 [soil metagenome]
MAHALLDGEVMRFPWLVLVTAVTGLAGCRSGAIDDRASEHVSEAHATAVRRAVYPTCADRAVVAGNCGLILKRAATEDFRVRFRDLKCVGKDTAECETLYQKMLEASLQQRYRLADWREVGLTCDANPGRCDDPVAYEMLLVDSHNLRVRDDYAREENEIESARLRAQARHVAGQIAVTSAVLGTAAAVVQRGPTCRSYPSAFTGETVTVCRD